MTSVRGGTAGAAGVRTTAALHLRSAALLVAVITVAAVMSACNGADDPQPSATASPTAHREAPTRRPTASPSPTVESDTFDPAGAIAHLRKLTLDIGPRPPGSPREHEAADYLRSILSSYGYEAELQPFSLETYVQEEASLELLLPEARPIPADAVPGSAPGTFEAGVFDAGFGLPEDLPGAAGRIVLVERSEVS